MSFRNKCSILFVLSLLMLSYGCGNAPSTTEDSETEASTDTVTSSYPHKKNWVLPGQHGIAYLNDKVGTCVSCHQIRADAPDCNDCHGGLFLHKEGWVGQGQSGDHAAAYLNNKEKCQDCHGNDFSKVFDGKNCLSCHGGLFTHGKEWVGENQPGDHGTAYLNNKTKCQDCHGNDFSKVFDGKTCFSCHDFPHNSDWKDPSNHGAEYLADKSSCQDCHGEDFSKIFNGKNCTSCHTFPHTENWQGNHGTQVEDIQDCKKCHVEASSSGSGTQQSCNSCHDGLSCLDCHDESKNGRRKIVGPGGDFSQTTHHIDGELTQENCLTCHAMSDHWSGIVKLKDPDGGTVYNYDPENPKSIDVFCLNCHDEQGATTLGGLIPFEDGKTVPNVKGTEGSLWEDSAHNQINYEQGAGKPLACLGDGITTGCHDNGHGSGTEKMLSVGGGINALCNQCHTEEKVINNAVSGASLANNIEQAFKFEGENASKHDLETNFNVSDGAGGTKTFTLQCTTCHNPHVVTGKYWDTSEGKSPITRPDFEADPEKNPRAVGKNLWGAQQGQKMNDYAGVALPPLNQVGLYLSPNSAPEGADNLADYPSFCLDCHAQVGQTPFGMVDGTRSWNSDPHGRFPANLPAYKCPNDIACGDATDSWPKIPLGRGWQQRLLPPYSQEARLAGQNYVLSCTDCHEAHGSLNQRLIRTNTNGQVLAPGYGWYQLCDTCHKIDQYMFGMSGVNINCFSCHGYTDNIPSDYVPGSLHGMNKAKNPSNDQPLSMTQNFNPELVAHMRFDEVLSNQPKVKLYPLDDASHFRLSARGIDPHSQTANGTTHSDVNFAHHHIYNVIDSQCVSNGAQDHTALFGCSVTLDGENDFIELGSTQANGHGSVHFGTYRYFEMKSNLSIMAWIWIDEAPVQQASILSNAGQSTAANYSLFAFPSGENIKLGFKMATNPNTWKGACSLNSIPLQTWTHVAATFDGEAENKIKIYINGALSLELNPEACPLSPPTAQENLIRTGVEAGICVPLGIGADPSELNCNLEGFHSLEGAHFFNGKIDEVKIFNVTKENIQNLKDPPEPPPAP